MANALKTTSSGWDGSSQLTFWFHSCEVGKNCLLCINISVSITYCTVPHWPSNKGQKYLQQVMHPWDVNCPMAVSTRNIGIPQVSRKRTYGTKNAPRKGWHTCLSAVLLTEIWWLSAIHVMCAHSTICIKLYELTTNVTWLQSFTGHGSNFKLVSLKQFFLTNVQIPHKAKINASPLFTQVKKKNKKTLNSKQQLCAASKQLSHVNQTRKGYFTTLFCMQK